MQPDITWQVYTYATSGHLYVAQGSSALVSSINLTILAQSGVLWGEGGVTHFVYSVRVEGGPRGV